MLRKDPTSHPSSRKIKVARKKGNGVLEEYSIVEVVLHRTIKTKRFSSFKSAILFARKERIKCDESLHVIDSDVRVLRYTNGDAGLFETTYRNFYPPKKIVKRHRKGVLNKLFKGED